MKILILCTYRVYGKHTNNIAPFIYEQVQALEQSGCEVRYLLIKGGGFAAYIWAIPRLWKLICQWKPDIIHAHGGLCGFIANLQLRTPVTTTYHGSDINERKWRYFSSIAIKYSSYNIFVSQKLIDIAQPKKNFILIPCGVDTSVFYPMDKLECKKSLGWEKDKIYILFSKAFYVKVKNYPLAKAAVEGIPNAELIELYGYTREQVNVLMNACDVALMTSFTEGSPQFIKEAMACNCPIVSTDVGDVDEQIQSLNNCSICSYETEEVTCAINLIIQNGNRSNGREFLLSKQLDNETIAKKILKIYTSIKRKNNA